MDIDEIVADIDRAEGLEDLRRLLHHFAVSRGFSGFNFIDAGAIAQDEPFWLGTAGREWEDEYQGNEFAAYDPVIHQALGRALPFSWSDVALPERMGRPSRAQQTMDAARDHGFVDGLVIPHHFRDDIGRTYSTCTCFFWRDDAGAYMRALAEHRNDIHLVTLYWAQKASLLAHRSRRGRAYPVGLEITKTCNRLTERERDVLAWAARGKTAQDTADILGIGTATAETHAKSAMRKLGASNRAHAVAKAILMGSLPL